MDRAAETYGGLHLGLTVSKLRKKKKDPDRHLSLAENLESNSTNNLYFC